MKCKYICIVTLLCLLSSFSLSAADYYWVGGGGNWSNLSHWATSSGGSSLHPTVPQSTDNVFFDANSGFTAGNNLVMIDETIIFCRNMDWAAAPNMPEFTGTPDKQWYIFGSVTFINDMSYSFGGEVHFQAFDTGHSITSAGQEFNQTVYFEGIGGEWTFMDTFSGNSIYHQQGILRTNDQAVFLNNEFHTSGDTNQALYLGNSTITCGYSFNVNMYNTAIFDAGTSSIILQQNNAYLSGQSHTFYNVTFLEDGNINSDQSYFNQATFQQNGQITGSNTYETLVLSPGGIYNLAPQTTQTITPTGTLLASGTGCNDFVTIKTSDTGMQASQATISHAGAAISLDFVTLLNSIATGGATFTINNGVDLGNNVGWTIIPPSSRDLYWVGGAGDWMDTGHWSSTSGGASGECIPTAYDNVFFDANSGFTAGASNEVLVNQDIIYCHDMTWNGVLEMPAFVGDYDKKIYVFGSLELDANMTNSYFGEFHFMANTLGETIRMNGQTFNSSTYFVGTDGEWTFMDTFSGNSIYHQQGILRTNDQAVFLNNEFHTSGDTNQALYLGNSTITCGYSFNVNMYNTAIFDAGTSSIILQQNNAYLSGQSHTFYNVTFLEDGNIYGDQSYFNQATFQQNGQITGSNTYETLVLSPGGIYNLAPQTTQTITPTGTLLASGTGCNDFVTIKTSDTGMQASQATISHAGAAISLDFVTLLNSIATGGATFTINNGVDLGNNVGWTIIPPSSRDLYWVGGAGDWMDTGHWSSTSGGASGECIPTAYDNVFFDANSGFTAGASNEVLVNQDIIYCHDMTWNGVLEMPAFVGDYDKKIYVFGSLELDANMTNSYFGEFHFMANTLGETIRMNGQTFNSSTYFVGTDGEWTFMDTFSGNSIYHQQGILRTNDQAVFLNNEFHTSGDTNQALYLGNSTITCGYSFNVNMYNTAIFDAGTSSIILQQNNAYLSGQSHTFYNVTFLEDGNINSDQSYFNQATFQQNGQITGSNTFHTLNFNPGNSYILAAGTTQTITPLGNFNANGNGSFPIEFKSSELGTQATLHKDGDPVCLDFLFLTDLAATGTGFSYVGENSDDVQNNDGWIFEECPPCFTAPASTAPILDAASVVMVDAGNTATLILNNLPANVEAVWYTEDQVTELYNDLANNFQPTISFSTLFYASTRDLNTGCVSELLPVVICATGLAPTSTEVCAGEIIDINLPGTVNGTIFNWTNDTPSIGLAASGTGDIPSFTAINTGANTILATISITSTYMNNGETCTTPTETFTIIIYPETPAAVLDPVSTTDVEPNTIATLILQNVPAGMEVVWYDEGQNFLYYADQANQFEMYVNSSQRFLGAIRDPNTGCIGETLLVTICAANTVAISNGIACDGSTTQLNLMETAFQGQSYAWSGPNGYTAFTQNPTIISPDANNLGLYTVMIIDYLGCTAEASTEVAISAPIEYTQSPTYCFDDSQFIEFGIGGEYASVSIQNNGSGVLSTTTANSGELFTLSGLNENDAWEIILVDPNNATCNITLSGTIGSCAAADMYGCDEPMNISQTLFDDNNVTTSGNYIVWSSYDGNDEEIYVYNGVITTQLTDNNEYDQEPYISGNIVVWGVNGSIMLHDLSTNTTQQIASNNTGYNYSPQTNSTQVIWIGNDQVYLYDIASGAIATQISTAPNGIFEPSLEGNYVIWREWDVNFTNVDLFVYDITNGGAAINASNTPSDDYNQQVVGNYLVWQSNDGNDDEVYFYDLINGGAATNLTNNTNNDGNIQSSNTTIVWDSDGEIYAYDFSVGGSPVNLSNNFDYEYSPVIDGDYVVWLHNENIILHHLTDGTTIELTDNFTNTQAIISGNLVTWINYGGSDSEIMAYNIANESIHVITDNTFNDNQPIIYGENIVWTSYDNSSELFISRLNTLPNTPVLDDTNSVTDDLCPSDMATLIVTTVAANEAVIWYDDEAMSNELYAANANNFQPTLTEDANLFGTKRDALTGCESPKLEINIDLGDNPQCTAVNPPVILCTDFLVDNETLYNTPLDENNPIVIDYFLAHLTIANSCNPASVHVEGILDISQYNDNTNSGSITFNFQAVEDAPDTGASALCSHTLTIEPILDFTIEIPADITVACIEDVPEATLNSNANDCTPISLTAEDTFNPNAGGGQIIRNWTIINWAEYNGFTPIPLPRWEDTDGNAQVYSATYMNPQGTNSYLWTTTDIDPGTSGIQYVPGWEDNVNGQILLNATGDGIYTYTQIINVTSPTPNLVFDYGITPPTNNDVTFAAPDVEVSPNSSICVPVVTYNFNGIITSQFSLAFDESVLSYQGINNVHPMWQSGFSFSDFNASSGNLVASWFENTLIPVSIPDNNVLFEVCFQVIGNDGESSAFAFTSNPAVIEVTDGITELPYHLIQGSVTVDVDATSPSNPTICQGENFDLSTIEVLELNAIGVPITYHSALPADVLNELPSPNVSPDFSTTYFIVANTPNGCSSSLAIDVNVLPTPDLSIDNQPLICAGESIDLASLNVVDNNFTGADWTYHSGTPTTAANELVTTIQTPATTTDYYISAITTDGCSDELAITVTVEDNPTQPIINGNTNISVLTDVTEVYTIQSPIIGAIYTWTIDAGATLFAGQGASAMDVIFSNSGTYDLCVIAESSNNCSSTQGCITIVVTEICPEISTSDMPEICAGESFDLSAITTIDANNTGAIYTYHSASPANASNQISTVITPNTSTNYYLLAEGPNGCSDELEVTLTVNLLPNISATNPSICLNDSYDLTTLEIIETNATNAVYTFHSASPAITANVLTSTTINPSSTTDYFILATTDEGCTEELEFSVIVNPIPDVDVAPQISPDICAGETYNLASVIWTGSAVISSFSWHTNSPATLANQITDFEVSPATTTTYYILFTDENGCQRERSLSIDVTTSPTALSIDYEVCEDPVNPTVSQEFTLDYVANRIDITGTNLVTYHLLETEAEQGANPLSNSYISSGGEILYARVEHPISGCYAVAEVALALIDCTVQNYNISDPCSCRQNPAILGINGNATTLQNGQFLDTVLVQAPIGETWTVVAVDGYYLQSSPQPPAQPIPFAIGAQLTEIIPGDYILAGMHVDSIGYDITVRNQDGVELSLERTICWYPTPVVEMIDDVCFNGTPITLMGMEANGLGGVDEFNIYQGTNGLINTVIGNTVVFDPQTYPAGTYTVEYAFDALTPTFNVPTDPGCEIRLPQTIEIVGAAIPVCNNQVQVSLDENCEAVIGSDMILEGDYSFNLFAVELSDAFGNTYGNVATADLIGMSLIATVTGDCDMNSCWGTVLIEDKLAPTIDCSGPTTITCLQELSTVSPPNVADNCTAATLEQVDEFYADDDICDDNQEILIRTWVATDAYGNISEACMDTVIIERSTVFNFPADVTWECTEYADYPNITAATPLTGNLATTGSGDLSLLDNGSCNYAISHMDDTLATCGDHFKIVRTWTVVDWCTGAVILSDANSNDNVQLIKVIDSIPPMMTLANDTVIINDAAIHPAVCSSTEALPIPMITDACSTWEIQIFTSVGEANYTNGLNGNDGASIPEPGLELGTHTITYQATDNCGNVSEITIELAVIDVNSPVAICDELTNVSLSSDGTAIVDAIEFDDGSTDNCCLAIFEIRRMNTFCTDFVGDLAFNENVHFCCDDIGQNVLVELRVTDCFDNSNTCMIEVEVEDKLPPTKLEDVDNQAIDCAVYYNNLEVALDLAAANGLSNPSILISQFGEPIYYDNCQVNVEHTWERSINSCGEGTIIRTWTAVDAYQNIGPMCQQIITINHVNDWEVAFPMDVTIECEEGQNPDETGDFGEPQVFFDDCELIAFAHEDLTFNVVEDACYQIIRTWTVINWCVYSENNNDDILINTSQNRYKDGGDGIIVRQQVITINDTVEPIIVCPSIDDYVVDATCVAAISLPTLIDIIDCSSEVVVMLSLRDSDNNFLGTGYNYDLPLGTYIATYTATDNCGNSSTCEVPVSVIDTKPPTPYCVGALVVELMPIDTDADGIIDEGMVELWASDFDAGSFDNCPGDIQLSAWLNADNYTSSIDLPTENDEGLNSLLSIDCNSPFNWNFGTNEVYLYVTDASGNVDYCVTTLIIESNPDVPPCELDTSDAPIIAGQIETETGTTIGQVTINLSGSSNTSLVTPDDGLFSFDALQDGGDYTVAPFRNDTPLNGVTTYDLVLIRQHILTTNPLDSPYQLIAADVNNSGTITTYDVVQLRQLILFVIDELPNNTSWRFVEANHVFDEPNNPWATDFPEVVNYNNLAEDALNTNFIGVKIGDVNGSAVANLTDNVLEERSTGSLIFQTENQSLKKGETFELTLRPTRTDILGYQFTLDFDQTAVEIIEVLDGPLTVENYGRSNLEKGVLTVSWNTARTPDNAHFASLSIRVKALEDSSIEQLFAINSRYTPAEAYDLEAKPLDIELQYLDDDLSFQLLPNMPNPFSDNTSIRFDLPEASEVGFTVYNLAGQVVYNKQQTFDKGYQTILVNRKSLGSEQLYYYALTTSESTAIGSMLLIK